MKLLLGFYYGIGDFISAVPTLRALTKYHDVSVAIGKQNQGLVQLLNLENIEIIYFSLFSKKHIKETLSFIQTLKEKKFDKIIVSPHAQDAVTSWKIPLMLKYIKSQNTQIIGANGDKNSLFYDIKIPIDKSIPLMQREIDFIKLSGIIDFSTVVDIENIFKPINLEKNSSIVIHPGASKPLKEWSLNSYVELINLILLNSAYQVIFIGLEKELVDFKKSIKKERVSFYSGSFEQAINLACQSDCIVTMDSGFGHIASALGLNHFVLIGSANPEHIKPIFSNSKILNIKKLSCQPCNGHHCHVGHNYCMDLITPEFVYQNIQESIKEIKDATNNKN